ncbi:MAG: hypothetical protein IH598_11225, partial [Bacteroidales bacterium]|nr:hypothetical protein [Bacteroidales bacterium]
MYCFYKRFASVVFLLVVIEMLAASSLRAAEPGADSASQFNFENSAVTNYFLDDLTEERKKQILDSLLQVENTRGSGFPPVWDTPVNTGTIHGYIINLAANPRINDIPLQPGDYMGGFFLRNGVRVCGGARMWTGTENVILTLFGDDNTTPIKDGFSGGELIEFRFFLWETQKEYIVTVISYYVSTGYVTNGRWYPTSLSMVMNMKAVTNLDFYISASENPVCINSQVAMNANEFVGAGGPYTFSWTSNPPILTSNVQTPPPVTLDVTTDFYLTVTDPNYTSTHQLTVVVHDHPSASAGNDGEICANQTFTVTGVSTNSLNTQWNTSGDGTFNTPLQSCAIYTPGVQDIANGSVTLVFSAEPLSPCSLIATDDLQLTVLPIPIVSAGEDRSACGNETIILEPSVTNYSSVAWTTNGSGTFTNPSSPVTQYIPSNSDITNGVTLTISAQAINPCVASVCDNLCISYLPGPTASGPAIIRRCQGQTFSLNGSVSNNSGILWTTQGDGTFSNPTIKPTVYTPGPQDLANKGTIVTLNALPIAPCSIPATKDVTLFIQPLPQIISFGPNTDSLCITNSYLQLAAEVFESDVLSWSTSGDGTLSSTNILNPKYYPGPNDKANGSFTLTLFAGPKTYCSTGTTLSKSVVITPLAEVFAGADAEINAGEHFVTIGSSADNYSEVQWITTGDGVFENASAVISTYVHGMTDEISGQVDLILIAQPIAPCSIISSDTLTLSIVNTGGHHAIADAGSDQLICSDEDVLLIEANAAFYASLEWNTTGDGFFENPFLLNPVYHPGTNDKQTGTVSLCLTAFAYEGFENSTDCLIVNITGKANVQVGEDATICEGMQYQLSGTAGNYSGFVWQTSGDGVFINPQSLSPVYQHGPSDVQLGSVHLSLKAYGNQGCGEVEDFLTLFIQHLPVVFAGSDFIACSNYMIQLSGEAQYYELLTWETNGDGIFNDPNHLQPFYTPGANDLLNGFATFCLTAFGINGCGIAEDCITVYFQAPPIVYAGDDLSFCQNEIVPLSGTAENSGTILWTTYGDGLFNDAQTLNPVYTPGISDINNGQVLLCLSASGIEDCESVSDCLTLFIQHSPSADAGPDLSVCGNQPVMIDATADNYTELIWTTNGDGIFDDIGTINPVYSPGENDLIIGFAELCLTAMGNSVCYDVTDCTTINYFASPIVEAGENITICSSEEVQLSGFAYSYNGLIWETSGDGSFNNAGLLTPIYAPGMNDRETGSVQLCLTAGGQGVCNDVADCLTITIQALAVANAGNDATVLIGEDFPITSASVEFLSSLEWTTSGTGTFSNPAIVNPIYQPSNDDYSNGNVVLTLTAFPVEPCSVSAVDQVEVTFVIDCDDAVAFAGEDFTTCAVAWLNLSGSAEYEESVLWQTEGDGSFSDATALEAQYFPGSDDISSGLVNLSLTAFALPDCANDTDYIVVTLSPFPQVNAGNDQTICESEIGAVLTGTAANFSTILWTTSGDGSFSDAGALFAIYNPGIADVNSGEVTLTLTAYSDFCPEVYDQVMVSITRKPIVFAGENASVCAGATFFTIDAFAVNFDHLLWSTSGGGQFEAPDQLHTIYHPCIEDINNGYVELCLKAFADEPCDDDESCFILSLLPHASVFAGEDVTICQTQSVILTANALNFSSVIWESEGDGSFSNAYSLTTEYVPGPQDIDFGIVQLSVTASSINGCSDAVSTLVVTVEKSPNVNAGNDLTICETDDIVPLAATAGNYTSILWTTDGDGVFSDASALNPDYVPGAVDIMNGHVNLSITAFANDKCDDATDHVSITIQQAPFADAGNDLTIIAGDSVSIINATVHSVSGIAWSTSGSGLFNNPAIINPVYYPSQGEIDFGSVTLTLTAFPFDPCYVAAVDLIQITIMAGCEDAIADAGEDVTICATGSVILYGIALNEQSVLWQTSGDGIFTNPISLETVYYPGVNDISSGTVTLNLTAIAHPNCIDSTDFMQVTLSPALQVDAGTDQTVCETEDSIVLDGSAKNFTDVFWTTSGNGIFTDPGSLNTTYSPGNQDLINGEVMITLTANSSFCPSVSDQLLISFNRLPIVFAGEHSSVCSGEVYMISDAFAVNYQQLFWSTSGDGYFDAPDQLNTTYQPGELDMINGSAELCLKAFALNPCADDEHCFTLTFLPNATVSAGEDMSVCESQTVSLSATAENDESVLWE